MTTYGDGLTNAVRNAFCTALGTINNYNNYFASLPFGFTNIASGPVSNIYRLVCNREPPQPPPPPFRGGQCCGLNYNVFVSATTKREGEAAESGTSSGTFFGRIDRITLEFPTEFSYNVAVYWAPAPGCSTQQRSVIAGGAGAKKYEKDQCIINDINVFPVSGSDDCGDPPPIIPPPDNNYHRPNIEFNYQPDFGPEVNLNGILIFARPTVNFNGNLNIPVRIDLGGVNPTFNGQLNLNGPLLQFNFGSPNYSPSPSPTPDDFTPPPDVPEVPDDVPTPILPPSPNVPDDDTTPVIRGVIVTSTIVPGNAGIIYQDGNPDIYIPNIGFVNFLVAIGQQVAWTVDLPVKNRRCLIPCPWEGGAIAVRGTPREGVSWQLSPVYALPEESFAFDD